MKRVIRWFLAAAVILAGGGTYFAWRSGMEIAELRVQMRRNDEAALSRSLEVRHSLTNLEQAAKERNRAFDGMRNGVSANGRLSVDGTQLVNQRGVPVQLRGLSSHGLVWFPQYINARALQSVKARGGNLFRAAMYSDSGNGGYNESPEAKRLSAMYLYLAVENALAVDMYAIVDWHLLMDENPLKSVDSAVEFFDEVSSRYADEPGVLYEICNEPNGNATWDDIYAYAEKVIPVIRKNSPNAVILVGTPRWSSDLASARAKPLSHGNLMYTYHMYTGHSDYQFRELLDSMRESGLPVFVSEWGISTDEKEGGLDVKEALDFIVYMREHHISWAYWSLSNSDEDFSVLKKDTGKLSGWVESDLSPAGKVIFGALGD